MSRAWGVIIVVWGLVVVASALALAACADPSNPNENDHARACVDSSGKIKERSQFGGKYSTSTYWCVSPDGQISDLWFEKDS